MIAADACALCDGWPDAEQVTVEMIASEDYPLCGDCRAKFAPLVAEVHPLRPAEADQRRHLAGYLDLAKAGAEGAMSLVRIRRLLVGLVHALERE